jgi:hypothetical protein
MSKDQWINSLKDDQQFAILDGTLTIEESVSIYNDNMECGNRELRAEMF